MQEMQETHVHSPDQEGSLEKAMATHSSVLAWEIPWAEEPGGLQPTGERTVRHDSSDGACAHADVLLNETPTRAH